MAQLTEEAKRLIAMLNPALVATATGAGKPNVSAKGSLRILDDEHLIFSDVNSPRTVANLIENPQVSIICLDAATRKSCRVWGFAKVMDSGPLFDEAVAAMAARNVKPKHVISIAVQEVECT